jgi:hypothetical protein
MRKSTILGLQKSLRAMIEEKSFPTVMFMMIMNLTLGRAKKKNQRSNRRGSLSPCPEPVSEQPSPERSQPASAFHPPTLS